MSKYPNIPREEHTDSSDAFERGSIRPEEFGRQIGTWAYRHHGRFIRKRVLNLGPVMIGTQTYILGAVPGTRSIFLGLNGRVWRLQGKDLEAPVPAPKSNDKHALRVWGDTISQKVVRHLTPQVSVKVIEETNRQYTRLVKSLVSKRIEEAEMLGIEKAHRYYAKAVNENWDIHDLISPRYPTVKHALYVSLVLALPAKTAAVLIEGAATAEYKCPFISQEIAMMIYQHAASLLSKLCPEWWNNGAFTRWEFIGSLDYIFKTQYANLIVNAARLNVDLPTAAGTVRQDILGSLNRDQPQLEE